MAPRGTHSGKGNLMEGDDGKDGQPAIKSERLLVLRNFAGAHDACACRDRESVGVKGLLAVRPRA